MKVLTVGGGGREHAAVEALYRSGAEIYAVMKNANPGLLWMPPLVVYEPDGRETAEIDRIYHRTV